MHSTTDSCGVDAESTRGRRIRVHFRNDLTHCSSCTARARNDVVGCKLERGAVPMVRVTVRCMKQETVAGSECSARHHQYFRTRAIYLAGAGDMDPSKSSEPKTLRWQRHLGATHNRPVKSTSGVCSSLICRTDTRNIKITWINERHRIDGAVLMVSKTCCYSQVVVHLVSVDGDGNNGSGGNRRNVLPTVQSRNYLQCVESPHLWLAPCWNAMPSRSRIHAPACRNKTSNHSWSQRLCQACRSHFVSASQTRFTSRNVLWTSSRLKLRSPAKTRVCGDCSWL